MSNYEHDRIEREAEYRREQFYARIHAGFENERDEYASVAERFREMLEDVDDDTYFNNQSITVGPDGTIFFEIHDGRGFSLTVGPDLRGRMPGDGYYPA